MAIRVRGTVRRLSLLLGVACAGSLLAVAHPSDAVAPVAHTRPAAATRATAVTALRVGQTLLSPNHRFSAFIRADGNLMIADRGHAVFSTRTRGAGATLVIGHDGNLVLRAGGRTLFSSHTAGSGAGHRLRLTNDGDLQLVASPGTVWTSRAGYGCAGNTSPKKMIVSRAHQRAWACAGANQLLSTPVTTGATAKGDGTPAGTWRIQSRQTNRYLYPSDGGRYFVHYWMPYDGEFGFHDSPWQKFSYGSSRYHTAGSHGCVHLPEAAMAWVYHWATVGTVVTVR